MGWKVKMQLWSFMESGRLFAPGFAHMPINC